MTTASPTKLLAARYVIAATAIVSATALTVGLAAPAVAATNVAHPTGAVAADNAPRQVTTDVALAALIDNFIGIYGVGPVFQALRMAGVNDPANLLKQAVGLIGNEQLSDAVGALTDVLGALADEIPIDAAVPGFGPAGVYDRVNALSYSGGLTSGINDILEGIGAIVGGDVEDLATNLQTILNQRRAFILGTGLGGTDTAMALNKMISEVEKDSALWGGDDNGVTAVVAVLLRNPSRTGGGLFALVTPISEIVGLDFSNPAGGSYTNKKVTENGLATKVLNVSITDVGWKYDLIADAPSTLNPLSWANAAVGLVMPTYLLPKDLSTTTGAIGDLIYPGGVNAVYDAVSVALDPTGGQGISLLTQGTFLEGGGVLADEVIGYIMEAISPPGVEFDFPFAGDSTYLTYNSGNLPLLEPFNVLPRLLGYTGAKISTPITGSFNSVLTQLVDFGYKDAVASVGSDGVWTFERTSAGIAAGAAEQSDIFLLPDSKNFSQWAATFELPQTVFDATLTGIQSSLLNPNNQLNLWGLDLGQYVYRNELTLAVANAVSEAIDAVKKPVNSLFNSGQSALEPVANALDTATGKVNGVIIDTRKALTGYVDLSNPLFEVNRAARFSSSSFTATTGHALMEFPGQDLTLFSPILDWTDSLSVDTPRACGTVNLTQLTGCEVLASWSAHQWHRRATRPAGRPVKT